MFTLYMYSSTEFSRSPSRHSKVGHINDPHKATATTDTKLRIYTLYLSFLNQTWAYVFDSMQFVVTRYINIPSLLSSS